MEQLTFFNMIAQDGEYRTEKTLSGSTYYTCAKCGRMVRIDVGKQHLKPGDSPTIYQVDICECGAVMKW